MSFHSREYPQFENRHTFNTSVFKEYCRVYDFRNIIDDLLNRNVSSTEVCEWRRKFPNILQSKLKNLDFKKWIKFIVDGERTKIVARNTHLGHVEKGSKQCVHAKINTMKLFFYERDRKTDENSEKIEIFKEFIKQLSKRKEDRDCEKLIKERLSHRYTFSEIFCIKSYDL